MSSVGVGLRSAEFHEKTRGRRLKAGGSQDWLPHFSDLSQGPPARKAGILRVLKESEKAF